MHDKLFKSNLIVWSGNLALSLICILEGLFDGMKFALLIGEIGGLMSALVILVLVKQLVGNWGECIVCRSCSESGHAWWCPRQRRTE